MFNVTNRGFFFFSFFCKGEVVERFNFLNQSMQHLPTFRGKDASSLISEITSKREKGVDANLIVWKLYTLFSVTSASAFVQSARGEKWFYVSISSCSNVSLIGNDVQAVLREG